MIKKYSTLFLGLFIGVSVIHLWGQINGYFILADTTKAMVIPTLGIWTYIRHNPSKRYGIALFFSWLGDLLLIPDGTSFFMIGIVSFLLTQLLYCHLMMQRLEGNFKQQFTKKKALLPLVLLGSYLIFILSLMGGSLEALLLPVTLYATALSVTGFLGILIARENPEKEANVLALGTLLFVLSDSMIAFDAFFFNTPQFTYWIMATYVPAQYCIAVFLAKKHHVK